MRHVSRGNLAISKLLRKAEDGVSKVSATTTRLLPLGYHSQIFEGRCSCSRVFEICEDEWLWYRIHQGFSDMKETK